MNLNRGLGKQTLIVLMSASMWVGSTAGCAPAEPAQAPSDAGQPAAEESAETAPPPEASTEPSSLHLVEAVAAQIASRWKTEKAIEEEQYLRVRFHVEGKSAIVLGDDKGGRVLTGMEAANSKTDLEVNITREDADAIAEGGSNIHAIRAKGTLECENMEGLDRFLQYIDDE